MSRVFWVRHGPTHEKAFVGWRDVPADLTDTDRVARLSAHFPSDAVVVSSDLQRSIATADAVQGARRRLPHMSGLREFHLGVWDGMVFDKVAEAYPDRSRAYWETPGEVAPPGGESWEEAAARIHVTVDHLRRVTGTPLVIVAHIGVILTQIQRAAGLSAEDALGHRIDNLSVTEIDHSGMTPQIVHINHHP